MIETLRIRNVGGIASAELDFRGSFVAITGESGTGKSSLVRALELLAGKRAQAGVLRGGEETAEVEGVFSAPHETEEPLRVRRSLSRGGRNRLYLQDQWATLADLGKEMGLRLQIQSQFAQLDLLEPRESLNLLDAFAGPETESLRGEMGRLHGEALGCDKALRELKERRREILATYASAETVAEEARGLPLGPRCLELWEAERQRRAARLEEGRALGEQLFALTGEDEGLLPRLRRDLALLTAQAPAEERDLWRSLQEEGVQRIEELAELGERALLGRDLRAEEAELDEVERRLGTLKGLLRRLRLNTEEELRVYLEEAHRQQEWVRASERQMEDQEAQVRALRREASRVALELRTRRKDAAGSLSQEVQRHLADLGMEEFLFQVAVSSSNRLHPWGADEVQFLLGTGDLSPAPIQKRASGGELSRLLLALQCSLRDRKPPATLVFDEVEAGLGGRAALLAGLKLRTLSQGSQVLLVTHEASLAALADQHFRVRREGDLTLVEPLEGEERRGEIARMLSGGEGVPEALEHARVLLEGAPVS